MHIGILGGGLIGNFTAYYLLQKGYKVTIFDQKSDILSASYGNAGMICPSHFIPLAAPGIVKTSLKWMLNPKSPLLFKPSFDLDFIKWCLAFYLNASAKNVRENTKPMADMLLQAKSLYLDLEVQNIIPRIEKKGIIMYCNSDHALKEEIDMAQKANHLGIQTTILSNEGVSTCNPGLKLNGLGGVHYTGDMHTDPVVLMNALKDVLTTNGANIISENVQRLVSRNTTITEVITSADKYKIDGVVLAAGVFTGEWIKTLGGKEKLQGGKGYNVTVENANPNLSTPMILVEGRVALTPMGNKLRIGGTMEIGKVNTNINQSRIEGVLESTEKYLPDFKKSDLLNIKPWFGYRPLSENGMPIIRKMSNWQNVFLNTGHGMLGLSLAPASGLLMEQIISNTLASS